jgi:acylaminoacyl-peptidase
MPRAPRPDDLYSLRIPTDVAISPDGRRVVFTLKESNPARDGYRHSLWIVDAEGAAPPRRLTMGVTKDTHPRWSPDGATLAFLSDRGAVLEVAGASDRVIDPAEDPRDRERSAVQVWLLPMDGGEARQLTRLPEEVSDLCWSPAGDRLCIVSPATAARPARRRRKVEQPPDRDARLIDRLQYQLNGVGFTYDRPPNLWVLDVATGECRRITSGRHVDEQPAWSPDGRRIAFVSNRHANPDLRWRTDVYLVDAEGGPVTRMTGGRGDRVFGAPAWSPAGEVVAVLGHRLPAGNASRNDVWLFRPRADENGNNLTAASDREFGAVINSDLSGAAEPRITWSGDGEWLVVAAPIEGSYELWRIDRDDCTVTRITRDEHSLSRSVGVPVGRTVRMAAIRSSADVPPDVAVVDVAGPRSRRSEPAEPRVLTSLMGNAWADVRLVRPVVRWHEVDGRRIQGWFYEAPRRGGRPAPLVLEIHGGPATMYGWSPFWEWQCLVAAGMSVYAANPRGSQGYGQDFCYANFRDWGNGPTMDLMAGIDALIADGLADPERLGVTGGSYGGYLTAWMIGHTDRFAAAVACRGVYDMTSEMLSGDIGGPTFGTLEYGANPWDDPELYRQHSPISYADRMRTPLLIQHAEKDLRCTITQAEELFTVLRSLHRPVRLLRTPDETHELTRSGTPYRRVENLERITDWFRHFLVDGARGLPPA